MPLYHHSLVMLVIQGVFLGLAWIFVLTRLYVRKSMVRNGISVDDYALILTLFLYTVFAAMISVLSSDYFLLPASPTPAAVAAVISSVNQGLHFFFLSEVFYSLTSASLRITVGLLLLRICQDRAQRITVYATTIILVLVSFTFLFLAIFQCTPVHLFWDFTQETSGSCFIEHDVLPKAAYFYAGVSFVSDWILGLMPVWLLWNVQMNKTKKFGIASMLGLGLLCGVAAITRVVYIGRLENPITFAANWIGIGICSTVEGGLGLIAASIASFRPIFATRWFQALSTNLSVYIPTRWKSSDRDSWYSWRKNTKPNQASTAFTGTTVEEHAKNVGDDRRGPVDEEDGTGVSHIIQRRESPQ